MLEKEIDTKAMKAVMLFNDGWSMNMSMSKAGFVATWNSVAEIRNHPLVKTIKSLNDDNLKKKRKLIYNY